MFKKIYAVIIFFSIFSVSANSQNNIRTDTTIIPAKEYRTGVFHNFIFGMHWRDVWTEPIKVELLDLNKFAGGLTPSRKGGGLQTRTLHLTGADGLDYKFRSIDKNPAKMLPEDLKETFVADVTKRPGELCKSIRTISCCKFVKSCWRFTGNTSISFYARQFRLGKIQR